MKKWYFEITFVTDVRHKETNHPHIGSVIEAMLNPAKTKPNYLGYVIWSNEKRN